MVDFQIARAEFKEQTSALLGVIDIIDAVAQRPSESPTHSPLPAVPRGGQNTISSASIVLLAAHFEEYIRQQVQEYSQAIINHISNLEEDARVKFLRVYWRGGVSRLNRLDPGDLDWASDARSSLHSLTKFPIDDDSDHIDTRLVTEHENNMRWETITELTGRVGIKTLSDRIFGHSPLRDHCDVQKRSDMASSMRKELNSFYKLRNTIVHSISQSTGIGRSIVDKWCIFLELFAEAFSIALEQALNEFNTDIEFKLQKNHEDQPEVQAIAEAEPAQPDPV